MNGQPLLAIVLDQPMNNAPWLTRLLRKKQLYAARWVLIGSEAALRPLAAAHPRRTRMIASARRARLGRLNLMIAPEGISPLDKAEELCKAGEADQWMESEQTLAAPYGA